MIKPDSSDIQTNLYEHSWTIKNKEFADKLLERILPEKGFIGKKFVNYNIENMIIEMIVKHFKEKGITIPINDFTGHLHASDRGFQIRAKPTIDNDGRNIEREYYFDLVTDKIFMINKNTHMSMYWFEETKRGYKLEHGRFRKIVVEEYSLDFLSDVPPKSSEQKSPYIVKDIHTHRPSSITASSTLTEPADRNAYSPAKVFDARPETGWMEKKDGPGIGEWVKISFDQPVTADKLVVSPGYFDSRYWKDNNRIKRLLISLDTYTQFVDFTDNMTPQEVPLGKARTFSTATFTIVEVYKTSHWDDTALAEVEFWNEGRKLEIDLSGFEDKLKVVPE